MVALGLLPVRRLLGAKRPYGTPGSLFTVCPSPDEVTVALQHFTPFPPSLTPCLPACHLGLCSLDTGT